MDDHVSPPHPASSPHPLLSHPPAGDVDATPILCPAWLLGVGLEGAWLAVCLGIADWLVGRGVDCFGAGVDVGADRGSDGVF